MKKSILIVEDETDIREAMYEAMLLEGFNVLTAINGDIGLKTALSEKPDLILLDIIMPIMTGHEMLNRLRTDTWGKTVKVIMLTSMDDVNNIGQAHEGAITDYMIKAHSSLDEIISRVKLSLYTN